MRVPFWRVAAFADRPDSGNPAGVCLLRGPARPAWMQAVARELALSETAFLWPERGAWRLRWFTPTVEARLCGHATLAAAHALWEAGRLRPANTARFFTRSGELRATRRDKWISLDFPALAPRPCAAPPSLLAGLGFEPLAVLRGPHAYLALASDERRVRELEPDARALARLPIDVTVTARSASPRFDFVSRYFAPASGIGEDPVTGSAHCMLAPYWAERLGKTALSGRQLSARGGVVRVTLRGDRAALLGRATTVILGELTF